MAKVVHFKDYSGKKMQIDIGADRPEDLTDGVPPVFDTEVDHHARYVMLDCYANFYKKSDPNGKPVFLFRHTNKDSYRFGGFVELGDGPLDHQKGGRYDIAQSDAKVNGYRKISDNPLCYGIDTEEPFSEYRVYNGYSTWKETDIFDVKATYWPETLYDHQSSYPDNSIIYQTVTLEGTFQGEPIVGIGGCDKVFMREDVTRDLGLRIEYFYVNLAGIRPDGRREQMICNIDTLEGKVFAYYYCDGEKSIITDEVSMEADWHHLPYCEDGTCCYKNAIFRFAGKEFHFTGKWGTKGFTEHPRLERHGQSQIVGTWYEGDTPYEHTNTLTFMENMEAYKERLNKLGFDVVD